MHALVVGFDDSDFAPITESEQSGLLDRRSQQLIQNRIGCEQCRVPSDQGRMFTGQGDTSPKMSWPAPPATWSRATRESAEHAVDMETGAIVAVTV